MTSATGPMIAQAGVRASRRKVGARTGPMKAAAHRRARRAARVIAYDDGTYEISEGRHPRLSNREVS